MQQTAAEMARSRMSRLRNPAKYVQQCATYSDIKHQQLGVSKWGLETEPIDLSF